MEYLNDFLLTLKSKGMSEHTLDGYGLDIRKFFEAVGKGSADVKPIDARRFFNDLTERGQKPKTRNRKLAALNSYYKFCIKEELLADSPLKRIDPAKTDKTLPKFLTEQELRLMIDNAATLRLKAILLTLYATGARVSELCSLDRGDLNFDAHAANIKRGKGGKQRKVYLTDEAIAAITEYWDTRQDDNPAVFVGRGYTKDGAKVPPQRVQDRVIQADVRQLGKRLGIKQRVHPHLFRKTLASHMVQRGADILTVSKILGHADVSTTQIYAALTDEVQHEAFDRLINNRQEVPHGADTAPSQNMG